LVNKSQQDTPPFSFPLRTQLSVIALGRIGKAIALPPHVFDDRMAAAVVRRHIRIRKRPPWLGGSISHISGSMKAVFAGVWVAGGPRR